jgi:polyhydroxyalkanoate synthase
MRWYEIALIASSLALAAWLLLVWHVRFWERRLTLSLEYALEEGVALPDGARIELRRLPQQAEHTDLPPVLVVHGVGANHRNNDLSEDVSLARHLSRAGRDVWLLTLRSGLRARSLAETRRVRFRSMAHHDVPVAVREVLARTRHPKLDYVGFSMGGMLLYAALGATLDEKHVRRVAIIGSPAVVKPPVPLPVPRFVGRIPSALYPTLRLRLAARAGAFAVEWLTTPAHHWVFNPKNVSRGVARTSLVNVIEDIPGPLNSDLASFAANRDGAIMLDGAPVLERLRGVRVPAAFFAGAADRLAPPASVRAAFDAWAAEASDVDKRFVVLGVEHGAAADYGHGDLAVGSRVNEELFAPLSAFLSEGEERVS